MEKLKVGLIGCGKVAHLHAKSFQTIENCELVAVYNHHLGRAQEFAAAYGIKAFDSMEQMVKETGVQAVSICTPHPNHAKAAVEAADLKLSLAIEKPLAISLEDCDMILQAVQRNQVVGSMVCQRRFYPSALRMKQAIDSGKIGKPILASVNVLSWRSMEYYHSDPWRGTWQGEGGGVLVNQAVHQLDLLLWFMGDIEEIYGMWDTLNHPQLEVDDTAVAVIRFRSGALGSISVSNSTNPGLFANVRVHGYNGASIGVQTDGGAMFIAGMSSIAEPPVNDLWTVPGEENMLSTYQEQDRALFESVDSSTYFHTLQLQDFVDAVIEKRKPAVPLEDGRKAVELFQAIYRSGKEHMPVRFPM